MGHRQNEPARYGCQLGWGGAPRFTNTQPWRRGAWGETCRRMPASLGVRFPLWRLHLRHDATTFSHECVPPRDRGTTWSMFSAAVPQYWQE
jgi:hypothetical protein